MEVDIKDGLIVEIKHTRGDVVLTQILDYWRVPFRCSKCHEVGHLWKDYFAQGNHGSPRGKFG